LTLVNEYGGVQGLPAAALRDEAFATLPGVQRLTSHHRDEARGR
jgi:hypothetical protein